MARFFNLIQMKSVRIKRFLSKEIRNDLNIEVYESSISVKDQTRQQILVNKFRMLQEYEILLVEKEMKDKLTNE